MTLANSLTWPMRRCVAARHTRVKDGFPNVAISLMTRSARGDRIDMAAAALDGGASS